MGWIGSLGLWLQEIGEGPRPDFLKFVALLLALPCFKASNFLFQLAYAAQQRRLRLLGRESVLLGGEDHSLEFEDLPLNFHRSFYVQERLRHIRSRCQAT